MKYDILRIHLKIKIHLKTNLINRIDDSINNLNVNFSDT